MGLGRWNARLATEAHAMPHYLGCATLSVIVRSKEANKIATMFPVPNGVLVCLIVHAGTALALSLLHTNSGVLFMSIGERRANPEFKSGKR